MIGIIILVVVLLIALYFYIIWSATPAFNYKNSNLQITHYYNGFVVFDLTSKTASSLLVYTDTTVNNDANNVYHYEGTAGDSMTIVDVGNNWLVNAKISGVSQQAIVPKP